MNQKRVLISYVNTIIEGIIEPIPQLLNDVSSWAVSSYCNTVKNSINPNIFNNKKIDDIINVCNKNITDTQANSKIKTFQIDPSNWKYRNIKNIPDDFWSTTTIIVKLVYTKSGTLTDTDTKDVYSGLYHGIDDQDVTIEIIIANEIKNAKQIENNIDEIKKIVKHELIHLSQELLNIFSGQEDRGSEAGLPSKKISKNKERENSKTSYTVVSHSLRDVEFYTKLNDTIDQFTKLLSNIPPEKRVENLRNYIKNNKFLKDLQSNNKEKWNKAIKELYKALKEKGIAL